MIRMVQDTTPAGYRIQDTRYRIQDTGYKYAYIYAYRNRTDAKDILSC